MSALVMYGVDLVAITVLVFALFLPRHRRPELVVSLLTVNVGVLAVSTALITSTISAGLGLGLFGILSIIRLRSEELAHSEIAYYFAALALGLLGGLNQSPTWLEPALMTAIVAAVAVGDSPRVGRRPHHQQVMLDHAHTDPDALVTHLELLLGGTVLSARTVRVDLVNDTTLVDVRYVPSPQAAPVEPRMDDLAAREVAR